MKKFKLILNLFITFFKIGLFTFGGGYAMISVLEHEFVERKKWIEHSDFYDMVAIAESTPGPIAINSATFIGYKKAGFFGSLFSTLGVVLPSLIIIFVISLFFDKFLSITLVSYAFKGIQACVAFLILRAGVKMVKKQKNVFAIVITSVAFTAFVLLTLFAVNLSSIWFIIAGACVGLIAYAITLIMKKKKNKEGK